jgi:hypothetical protein
METKTIAQRLALAEARVQQYRGMVSRQRQLVRHLQRHSLGIFDASRLLKQLEETQVGFIAERDQLKLEMAQSSASPTGPAINAGTSGQNTV